ncbi:MAG: 3-methyl-2-oxobutanoate hydroxymethyltransferase [Candidatus Omnitrophica bacterium]|nr:3-methyl-2-oxobutanoate hydroxymethyltransferase [Candidatus Omnitrophota bacterium]
MTDKVSIESLLKKKSDRIPITLLTAYDYPMGSILDSCDIDIILVGDSVANVVLGLESTTSIGMYEMLHHAKAVRRAVKRALLVGDMPYESYQLDQKDSVKNARRFMDEAGCEAVKLEWFDSCCQTTADIINAGIPVMGHIGLTPQTADKLGGFKVQGKDAQAARKLIDEALLLEKTGIFAIVLECIPDALAGIITEKLKIPTIGIGAGPRCDGQALVTHDLLGLFEKHRPKFVKEYVNLSEEMRKAISAYRSEVEERIFPSKEHSYTMKDSEVQKLKGAATQK